MYVSAWNGGGAGQALSREREETKKCGRHLSPPYFVGGLALPPRYVVAGRAIAPTSVSIFRGWDKGRVVLISNAMLYILLIRCK